MMSKRNGILDASIVISRSISFIECIDKNKIQLPNQTINPETKFRNSDIIELVSRFKVICNR